MNRPITICSKIGKFFEKPIFYEINTKCDHGDNQLGFRKGLGGQNAHLTFLAILDRYRMLKRTCMCVQSVFQKRSIPSSIHILFFSIKKWNQPFPLGRLLWNWYSNMSIRVRLGSQPSKFVTVRKGVKKSPVLSSAIFNNVIRTVTKNIPLYPIEPHIDFNHLFNADDILLLSANPTILQNTVHTVCSCLNEIGLQVASSKTELLVYSSSKQPSFTSKAPHPHSSQRKVFRLCPGVIHGFYKKRGNINIREGRVVYARHRGFESYQC